jgi:hypothetical protein
MQRIVNSILTLFDLNLGGAAKLDNRYAARQLSQPLLELFFVVVGCRFLGRSSFLRRTL